LINTHLTSVNLFNTLDAYVEPFKLLGLIDFAFKKTALVENVLNSVLEIMKSLNAEADFLKIIDHCIFFPKDNPFIQNLAIFDLILSIKSQKTKNHALRNFINFNIEEYTDILTNIFFLKKVSFGELKLEEVDENDPIKLVLKHLLYEIVPKDKDTKAEKYNELKSKLIAQAGTSEKELQLPFKFIFYKGKIALFHKTDLQEKFLNMAFNLIKGKYHEEEEGELELDIDELQKYNKELANRIMSETWLNKTLEIVIIRNIISLVMNTQYIEAAKIYDQYQKNNNKEEKIQVMFKNLSRYLEKLLTRDEEEIMKRKASIEECLKKLKKL